MTITPADIQSQQFPIAFRGYNVEAVDTFLDRLQADLAEMLADRAGAAPLTDADTSTPTGTDHLSRTEDGPAARALRTLARAEQMAEQMMADAVAEADGLRARAQVEAQDITAAARAESSRIEAEPHLRRQREVGGLMIQAQQLRSEIDRLAGLERQYRAAMLALLSEQQRLLEQGIPDVEDATATEATPATETLHPAA